MNREQRRHPEKAGDDPAQQPPERPQSSQHDLVKGPPDTQSSRAKSSGHGKKTADKWNQ